MPSLEDPDAFTLEAAQDRPRRRGPEARRGDTPGWLASVSPMLGLTSCVELFLVEDRNAAEDISGRSLDAGNDDRLVGGRDGRRPRRPGVGGAASPPPAPALGVSRRSAGVGGRRLLRGDWRKQEGAAAERRRARSYELFTRSPSARSYAADRADDILSQDESYGELTFIFDRADGLASNSAVG